MSQTYKLALFDESESNKWDILRKNFVVESIENGTVYGVYLTDLWFNKEVGKGDYKNSLHFILIESKYTRNYILDDLNRLVCINHRPSSLDIPSETSSRSMYFCLDKDTLNSTVKFLIDEKINHKHITLKSKNFKAELTLYINYNENMDLVTISLPRFQIY